MRHAHFPLRTSRGPTQQQAHELSTFLERLHHGRITTPELIAVFMILREYGPARALQEWCNGAAHKKRDRGTTHATGVALWAERLQIDRFFAAERLSYTAIPIPIFETLIEVIRDRDFGLGGLGLARLYPDGYSTEEIVQTLRFLYRRNSKNGFYELISAPTESVQDVYLVECVLPLLQQTLWGAKPIHFDEIHAEIVAGFTNLIGRGKRILTTRKTCWQCIFCARFIRVRSTRADHQ